VKCRYTACVCNATDQKKCLREGPSPNYFPNSIDIHLWRQVDLLDDIKVSAQTLELLIVYHEPISYITHQILHIHDPFETLMQVLTQFLLGSGTAASNVQQVFMVAQHH